MAARQPAVDARQTSWPTPSSRIKRWWPPILLVAVTVVVYANSLGGAFLFDDRINIHDQPRVHALWPPHWLDSSRPLTELTFAANWRWDGDQPRGFHVVNLAIHLSAGLLLFGCIRHNAARILAARPAAYFGFAAALLWLIHPLQTQSVTYIVQRAEALASALMLLTLYGAIRALEPTSRRQRWGWWALAIAACALAQSAKPMAVTAPLLVMLHDRAIGFPACRSAWAARWPLYVGLIGTWSVTYALGVVPGLLVASPDAPATVGLAVAHVTPWTYLCTQAGVILHYLRLTFWPDVLVLDYGWPVARGVTDAWVAGLAVIGLLVGAWAAWRRWPWAGYALLWFFIVLAPTSSIVPIADPIFEHRMYLPLAGLIVVALAGSRALVLRLSHAGAAPPWAVVCLVMVMLSLGARTIARNHDYRDPVRFWRANVQHRPDNPRAHNNLCQALNDAGSNSAALTACDAALALLPDYADAWNNRANVMLGLQRPQEAANDCAKALALRAGFVDAHVTCGYALTLLGQYDDAIAHERAALAVEPANLQALNNLGNALARRGDADEARATFERALSLDPRRTDTHNNLAWLLAEESDLTGAAAHLEQALAADPAQLTAAYNLGEIYHRLGRDGAARQTWMRALQQAEERGLAGEAALLRSRLAELSPP